MSEDARGFLGRMVTRLIEQGFVQTERVERAFRAVPRHLFLPGIPVEKTYSGEGIVTRCRWDGLPCSSSSEPGVMACMLEQLRMEPGQRVLEIGAGTGYNAAVLSALVGPRGRVTTVDLDEDISVQAAANLRVAGMHNVRVLTGDGWLGAPDTAPFDRIEATAAVWDLSPHWHAQMANGGLLVIPLIFRAGLQASVAFRKEGLGFHSESVQPAGFMRLRGPHGGPQVSAAVYGWRFISDEMTPENAHILGELLQAEPRVEVSPVPPHGWFTRLALEDPRAVWLTHAGEPYASRVGIFVPEHSSLAVLEEVYGRREDVRLLAYGDHGAAERLREWLKKPPLSVRQFVIHTVPAGTGLESAGARLFRRPTFDVLVRYPTSPSQ